MAQIYTIFLYDVQNKLKKLTEKYVKEYRDLSEYDTVLSNYYNYIDLNDNYDHY